MVDAVGADVIEFAPGDHVFGVNADRFGAHAELLCVRERAPVVKMPPGVSFEEAASVCDGAVIALACLRRARIGRGSKLLIYGASGSIGTAAVQLAVHAGAEVTAVCATNAVEVVRSLGPARVIDYTREHPTAGPERDDAVLDAVGKRSFWQFRRSLAPRGLYMSTDLGRFCQNPPLALASRLTPTRRISVPIPRYRKRNVEFVRGLLASGDYRAVIDRRHPLEEVVEATRYVECEQKIGNVVLTVAT